MLHPFCILRRVLGLTLLLAGLSGCASSPKPVGPVHVLVTANGLVDFRGEQFPPGQLPDRLAKAGVDEKREIRLHMEDIRNKQLWAQIYNGLLKKGFKRVLILDEPRASSEVAGEPESRTETPATGGTPPAPAVATPNPKAP